MSLLSWYLNDATELDSLISFDRLFQSCGAIKRVIIQVGVSVNCADIVRISESVGISLLNKWWHKILQVRRS